MSDSAIPGGFNPGKFRETNFGLPFVTPVQTDEFTQEESDRRLARYMASAKILDDADLVKLDENQKVGLFRATTKGMFGIEDLDGSFCFGKKSGTVDSNIENLRKFAHGDFGVITTDEAKAWSGMDEEQKFQYALEHEGRRNKVKSNINGDRGDSLLLRLMMNSGNGMGYAQLPSDSQLEARAESYRRNNYDTMTPEEQARYRADVIGDYERKIAGEQPLATFLSASGQLSDRAQWLLADAYSNGSIDVDQMASLDEDERDHVYSTLAAMRGDKKKGRLFTTLWMNEQDFTDDTAMNRVQIALYGGQQAFLEMFTEPFGLARDVAKWAWYKVALDESKRKDAFDRWNAEEKAKQALEQPLPDATTFLGAAVQGLAENWTFWAQYGIADRGAKAFKAASKAAKIAKATEKAAEKFKGRAIAKAFVNAEISGLPKSEADALFAIRSAVICEQYTRRLQKAQAMAKGAKVTEGVGAAEFAAGHLSAYARFVNEYVENADAAGVSREISLLTSILVGAVNEIIERIYVPGLEKNVPGDELKAMMLSSMYRMVKRDGAKGFRRYLELTLPRFIGQTARVTAQEGFVEEPLQQEVIESATLMDEMRQFNKELDERGVVNDELRKKIDNELENFWRNGWKTFVDTAAEAFPTSFGFGVTSIGNMQIRQYLRDRMRLSKARKAGSDYSVDEGALAFLSRKMNLKKQIFDFWATDEDGNPTIQTKEDKAFYGNEFEKGLREARKIVRDGTGDVAQRIANAMNLDLKGAELVEDFVRIEDTLQKASPTISQIVQGSALVDINEDTIGTILPGYVKGSLVKDDENGVYTAKYKIGDAERTVAYRTKDTYETLVQFALNNPDAYRGSYEAATENDPNAVPWEEFSKDPTSLEKFIRKNVNAYTDNNEANILVTDEDGKQHLIRVDDVVYLMEGRPGDVGYGDATMTDARHESFHPIWTFLRSTAADKEDVRKFALNQFGIDISDPTGDAKFDDIMAYEYQEYASGNYVSPGVSEFLTKMEQSGFGKFLKSIADKIGIADVATMPDPENPGGRKKIGLGDLYDLIMRGKIGTGWAGVEKAAGGVTAKVGENEVRPSDSGEMPEVDTGSEEKPKEPVQAPAQSVSNPTAPRSEKEPVPSVEYTAENPAPPEVSNAKFYRIQADGEGKVFLVGELEVAEAEDSVTSYNEGYTDPDLQNRGTGTEDSIAAAENIASNLDPRQTSLIQPRANNGIKWVTPSGMVFIGNTRTRGEQLAYERGTAGALDEFVRAQATLHGLTIPEGMRHPTLRFRLIRVESPDGTNISMRDVVRMTNESQQRGMDEVEQAGNDALIFENEDILSGLSFRSDGRIDESKSGEAIGKFRRATGMQGMIGEDGLLTEAGEKRLVSAAIASLIGSSAEHKPLLRKIITDSGRLDIRSQLRALVAAAPILKEIAKQKPAYDLTNDLSDALRRFVEWRDADESRRIDKGATRRSWRETSENGSRKRGISWERHSSQGDMFDNQTEASKVLSEMLAKTESLRSFDREDNESEVGKLRVVSLIGGFLGDFANNAKAANPEADMFGAPGTTKEEILSVQRDKKDSFGAPRFSTASLFNDDGTINVTPETVGMISPEMAQWDLTLEQQEKYRQLMFERDARMNAEIDSWDLTDDEIKSIESRMDIVDSIKDADLIMPDGKLVRIPDSMSHSGGLATVISRPMTVHGRRVTRKDGTFVNDFSKPLLVAVKSGVIRVASNRGGLELEGKRKLSSEQISRVEQYIDWANKEGGVDGFSIDYAINGISDSSSPSVRYQRGVSSSVVLEDLREYREEGLEPGKPRSVYGLEYDQFFSREYWKSGNFSVRPVYTGTGMRYTKPSLNFIGTGEGSQVYGWGLYGSAVRGVAEVYAGIGARKNIGMGVSFKGEPLFRNWKGWPQNDAGLIASRHLFDMLDGDTVDGVIKKLHDVADYCREMKLSESYAQSYDDAAEIIDANRDDLDIKWDPGIGYIVNQTFFTDREDGDESHLLNWYEEAPARLIDDVAGILSDAGYDVRRNDLDDGWKVFKKGSSHPFFGFKDYGKSSSAVTVQAVYSNLANATSPKDASIALAKRGWDGIKYPANSFGSKSKKDGDVDGWNYVSFRDDNIRIDSVDEDTYADKGRFSVAIGPIGARRIGGRYDRMFDAILQSGARKDRKLVWQNTGWYKGVDGKWRTRVSNGKINKEFEKAATVGEILDGADDLFLAYPELKKIRIVHRKLERGTLASLEGSDISIDLEKIKNGVGSAKATYLEDLAVEAEKYREIAADPAISGDSELRSEMDSRADEAEEASRNLRKQIESEYGDRVLESIVHEIQHYIQDEEGFARGTNVDYEKELAERRSARLKELFDDVMSQLQKVGRIKDEAKRIEEGQILNFKLLMIKAEDVDLQDMIEKNDFYPVYFRSSGEVEARYASHSRSDDPSDRSGEAPWEWMNNSGDRLAVPEHAQTVRFSTISDRARIEKLEEEISRGEYDVTYRAMELAVDEDGRKVLIPPMAGIVDGKLNSPAVEGEWVEPEDLTHLVPKSGRNKGKFPLKYRVTNQETGKTKIQTTWVALNPYIHSSFNPFNDQFSAAYNRPNMVVVRLLVPKSASTGEKIHPLAKNAPGLTEWNYGPVSKQLIALGKPARKVMLSTAAKIDSLLSDGEVADLFDEISKGVKDKLDIPSNAMTPGLRVEFERRGYRIDGKVRFSTRVADEEWEAAKQEFGLTDNAFEAGYILPDGSMLDFSEKNNGGPGGMRTLDHRAIGGVISRKDRPGEQRAAMEDAMSSGAIRVYPEMPGFELRSEPSTSAMWTLREAFDQLKVAPSAGQWGIMVEFSTPYVWNGVETGDYQHQRVEYSPKTSSERVAEDIRTFFRDGVLPDGTFDNGQFSAVKRGNYVGVREGALREYQERQNAAIRRIRNDEPMLTMLAKGVTGCRARTDFLGIRRDGVAAETMLMLSTIRNRMELTERARRFFENESPMTDKVIRQIKELSKGGTVKIILKPAMMLPAKKTTWNSIIDDGNGVILRKVDSFTTAFIEHLAKKTGAVPDWTVKSGWLPTDAKLPHERMPFLETGVRASSLDNEFSFIVGGVLFNELPLVHMANMTPNVVGMAAYAVNRNGTLRGMPVDVDIVDGDFVLTPGQDGSIHDVLAKLSPGNARRGYRGYREFVSEMALYPPTILDRINQWEDARRLCQNPESRMFVKICEQRANNRQAPKTDEELDFEAWDEYRLARLASPVASRTDKTVEVGRSLNGDGRIIIGGDLDLLRGYKDPNGVSASRAFYLFARAAIEQIKEQKDNPEISYSQLEDYVVDQMKRINKEFGKDEKQAVGWFHGYVASKFIGTGKYYNRIKGAAENIARKLDKNGHIIDRLAKIVKGDGRVVFAYAMHLNSRNIIPQSAAQYLSEAFHRRTGKPCSFVQFEETSNSHLYGKTRAERFNTVLKFGTKALFHADDQIVIVDDVVANGTTMAALLNHIVENEHVDPVGAVALSADYQMIDISKGQLFASDSTLQTMSEYAKLPQQQIRGILGYGTDRLTDPEARGICNVLRRKGVGGLGSFRIHTEGESNDVGSGSFVGEGQANGGNRLEKPGYSSGANLYLEARDLNTGLYSPEAVRAMDELFKTPGTKSARNRGAGSDLYEVATRRGIDLDAYRASGGKFSARPGDLIAAKQFDSLSSPRFSILNRNIVWSELPESLKTVINSTSLSHLESADRNKVQRDYFYSLMGDRNTWASEKPEARRYAEKLSKQLGTEWLGKYLLAKHFSGDSEAVQVVRHYVKQNAIGAIREAWDQSRPLRIAYVQSQEGTGINRIPLAYAAYLENALGSGATVDGSVVKVSTDQNTRADQKDRVSRDFKFESEGPIDQASQYLIVDDTWTSGQTTVSMLDYLRQQGADVIGITTIATGRYGKKIIPEESQLRRAVEKAKLQSIEQANQVLAFDLRKATGSELHGYILQGKQGPQGLQHWFREVNSPMLPGVLPNQGRVVSGNRENEGASEAAARRSLTATGSEPTYNGQMVLPGFSRFSSVYPQFNNLSDDDLMSIAVATDIALGKSDKVSDRSVKIARVQKMVKQMHPEYTTAQVGVESARVATDAQRLAKRIREDLERGVSESAIISHLPEAYRATFGKEMLEQARTGAKIGSKNAKAYLALKGRRDKLIEDAVRVQTGVETKMLENEYGIDLSKTLLAMSENPMDKPPVIHSQPTGAAVVVEDQESDTDAKDVSDAIKKAVDDIVNATKASSELNEQNRKNRENARKGEEERAKTIDGDEGAEGDGDLSGAQDPDIVEQAVRKAEVDIENPRHLAEFVVELARRYWIAKKGLAITANPWIDNVALQFLRKTAQNIYAKLLKDLTFSGRREAAVKAIRDLETVPTVTGLLSEMAYIGSVIHAQRIRDKRHEMVEELDKFLQDEFGARGRFKPDQETIRRKVSAESELRARYMRHAMWLTPTAVAEETQQYLEAIASISVEFDNEGKDKDQSREMMEAIRNLGILREFGGLVYKMPSEIEQAVNYWKDLAQQSGGEVEEANQRREDRTTKAAEVLARAFRNAARKYRAEGVNLSERMSDYIQSHMGFINLIRDMMRYSSETDREIAERIVKYLELEIQKAGTRAMTGKREQGTKFARALESIYGKDFQKVIEEFNKPDERFALFMGVVGGKRVQPTKGRAIQLLVSLLQVGRKTEGIDENGDKVVEWVGGYHDNIVKHHREDQAAKISSLLSPEDFNLIDWLARWYELNRSSLSSVSEDLFGIGVYAETSNYFPVKMQLPPQGLEKGSGVSWTIFPKALTPRVRNERDFDTTADILSLFMARMEEAEQWKAHAKLGLELRGIFGRGILQEAVVANHSTKAKNLMLGFITDILAGAGAAERDATSATYWSDKIRGWAALGALGGNAGVMMKQTTSIPAFGFEIGLVKTGKYILSAMTPEGIAAMKIIFNSEERKNRWNVGNTEEVKNALAQSSSSALVNLIKASMFTNKIGDLVPSLVVGQGIYRDALDQGMSHEDALAYTWMLAERTQQSSRVENQAHFQRRTKYGRALYQFLSTQQQYLQYEVMAIRGLAADPANTEKWGKLANALVLNHFILSSLYYWMGQLYKALLGQKPSDDELSEWIVNCVLGPYGALYGIGWTTAEAVNRWICGNKFGSQKTLPSLSFASNVLVNDPASLIESVLSKKKTWDDVLEDLGKWASDFNAVFRDLRKVYKNYIQEQ